MYASALFLIYVVVDLEEEPIKDCEVGKHLIKDLITECKGIVLDEAFNKEDDEYNEFYKCCKKLLKQ